MEVMCFKSEPHSSVYLMSSTPQKGLLHCKQDT
jgi:hypothetical protein